MSVVLASDRQLIDIETLCITTAQHDVLAVDPTLNITNHNVTVTTYRHLLFEVVSSNNSPVIVGRVLLHEAMPFESYYTLLCIMVNLRPGLLLLKAFGIRKRGKLS